MIFYVAYLETQNFEFHAYATTAAEARNLMAKAWKKHAKQTGAWLTWEEVAEWVTVHPMEMNTAHRR